MSVNTQAALAPTYVSYLDLGGGLNTRKDAHALDRNELSISVNCWSSYDRAIAKRPGNVALITSNGATGAGVGGKAMASCRFAGVTYLIVLQGSTVYAAAINGTTWANIGSVSASATFITAAQMFDPTTAAVNANDGIVFVCDGHSTPQYWKGPGTNLATVATGANNLPMQQPGNTVPITPQYVHTLGNNSHLFYSGDPTNPSAVYISDPFNPQQFTTQAMQVNPTGGGYTPAIIGNNDGVEGGPITGLETLGSSMIIFKQAAIYTMELTTLLGEIPVWQVVQVSNSVGCLSPRSIVRFDTFVAFLAIDGVYITDGSTVNKISGDVPTYFDSSLTGQPAIITNRTTAIGVRQSNKLVIAFQSSANMYCDMALWFDFDKQSSSGNPIAGQISNMNIGGAVNLRGPSDDGNFAWVDATQDRVGKFGVGFSDFGASISVLFAGKADLFEDVFGPGSPIMQKQSQQAWLLVEVIGSQNQQNVQFLGSITVNLSQTIQQSSIINLVVPPVSGGIWGSGNWGQMQWGNSLNNSSLVPLKIPSQGNTKGNMLQVAIAENSTVPWVCIGYLLYLNPQLPSY